MYCLFFKEQTINYSLSYRSFMDTMYICLTFTLQELDEG